MEQCKLFLTCKDTHHKQYYNKAKEKIEKDLDIVQMIKNLQQIPNKRDKLIHNKQKNIQNIIEFEEPQRVKVEELIPIPDNSISADTTFNL